MATSESARNQAYSGPERRTRATYVTRNTEYHCEGGVCVAVRDRQTRSFLLTHPALRRPLAGSVRFTKRLDVRPTLAAPRLGEGLFFAAGGPEVVTSNLLAIERPGKQTVTAYPV